MTVDEFIEEWGKSGGNERANTHLFVNDLCELIGVQRPHATRSDIAANDYVYERNVIKTEIDGATSNGWIDCYKRDCFILEAKQGSAADIAAVEGGQGDSLRDFFGQTAAERFKRGMAKRGTGQWTGAMQRAAGQAEGYAKALPADHGWPPFLLVTDVGYCIDVYADFQRSGKGYAPFPDRRRFRVTLEDLRDKDVRDRLAAIWDRPLSLDPSAESARVTREIAIHLATLARRIEAREQNPDRTAAFLMRLLFTMFAEDTGLIPKKSFSALLKKVRDRPENLPSQLTQLWRAMDAGGLAFGLGETGETVRQFNGYLFKETTAIPLEVEEIDVLIAAAAADWRQVEPAIFGTLLERALNPKERAKLGAHYTPRAYVDRLVGPTIMEPLREDWAGVRTAATQAAEAGNSDGARKIVETFHGKLAQTKVLDPACGTGNFLYVSMARMKELEGEVLELLEELGDDQYLAEISGHTITPENFLGIEINPRAANIAQLVLWIGYLQWHFRVNGDDRMPEAPVLRDVKTIENRDALITWDKQELELDQYGKPVTRWDGETMKKHPVTGKDVPDDTARVEVYRYLNPRATKWPKADFIIGNPPFIGNKRMRERLGDGYVGALRRAYPKVPGSVDYVMYWWARAASSARAGLVSRFGLITTNSIVQPLNRVLIEREITTLAPVSIAFAIPDHPWRDPETDAAVRVAMTVGRGGLHQGLLKTIVDENDASDTGAGVTFSQKRGIIAADLSVARGMSLTKRLKSNSKLSQQGVILVGEGFRLSEEEAISLRASAPNEPDIVKPYIIGQDLTQRRETRYVIDTFGLSEADLSSRYPSHYQLLVNRVYPARRENRDNSFRSNWWLWGRPRPEIRQLSANLDRYIATCRTAKHRIFLFEPAETTPDAKVIFIGLQDSWALGVLSSRAHLTWAFATGAFLEDRPNYNHSTCFEMFPFPDTSDQGLVDRIRDAAERLDALRGEVLSRHRDLTLTKLYNVLESLRAKEAAGGLLSDTERDIAMRGCISVIHQYHNSIDAAVAEAYGWPADLTDQEILERLVELNKARATEEAKGQVRWLRPDFQQASYVAPKEQSSFSLPSTSPTADTLEWPAALPDQFVAVAAVVDRAGRPIAANDVARAFKAKNAKGVAPVLDTLAGMGRLRKLGDGRYAA